MWFVYVLKSKLDFEYYIGSTNDINRRFEEHNSGTVISTKPRIPFSLEAYICVKTKNKAIQLEKYLKFGSGNAILKKRIL